MADFLENLLQGGIGALSLLDAPGSYVRGALGGRLGERLGGRELLEEWGVVGANREGLDAGDIAGFLAEIPTDPFGWVGGGLASTKGGRRFLTESLGGSIDDAMRGGGRYFSGLPSGDPPPVSLGSERAWALGQYPGDELESRVAARLFERLVREEPPVRGVLPGKGGVYKQPSREDRLIPLGNIDIERGAQADSKVRDALQSQYSEVLGRGSRALDDVNREIRQIEDRVLEASELPLEHELANELGYRGRDIDPMPPAPEGAGPLQVRDQDFLFDPATGHKIRSYKDYRPRSLEELLGLDFDDAQSIAMLGPEGVDDIDLSAFRGLNEINERLGDLGPSRLERDILHGQLRDPYFADTARRNVEELGWPGQDEFERISAEFSPEVNSLFDSLFGERSDWERLRRELEGIEATMSGVAPPRRVNPSDEAFLSTPSQVAMRELADAQRGLQWQGRSDLDRGERVARGLGEDLSPDLIGGASPQTQLENLHSRRLEIEEALDRIREEGMYGSGELARFIRDPEARALRADLLRRIGERDDSWRELTASKADKVRKSWDAPLTSEFGRSLDPDRLRELSSSPRFIEAVSEAYANAISNANAYTGRVARDVLDGARSDMARAQELLRDDPAYAAQVHSLLGFSPPSRPSVAQPSYVPQADVPESLLPPGLLETPSPSSYSLDAEGLPVTGPPLPMRSDLGPDPGHYPLPLDAPVSRAGSGMESLFEASDRTLEEARRRWGNSVDGDEIIQKFFDSRSRSEDPWMDYIPPYTSEPPVPDTLSPEGILDLLGISSNEGFPGGLPSAELPHAPDPGVYFYAELPRPPGPSIYSNEEAQALSRFGPGDIVQELSSGGAMRTGGVAGDPAYDAYGLQISSEQENRVRQLLRALGLGGDLPFGWP